MWRNGDPEVRRILCAHADESLASLLRPVLDDMQLVSATSAAAALRQTRDQVFDLYLIADGLPDMQGGDLCGRIRGFDSHTPILIYARSSAMSEGAAAETGTQGRIADPVDPVSTAYLVRYLLSVARSRSLDARTDECAAVVDELSDRIHETVDGLRATIAASELLLHDARLMARAYAAFSRAGGASADFRRMWPEVFEKARNSTSHGY